jgi:pimeloyl-ACP methyl ester carboxylesterase
MLRRLAVPTLVVHGDQDLVPVAAARHIADAVPGARLRVLKGSGHFAYLERPDDLNALVLTFCGEAR